jgi:undecaprenyl-diphosphatase
MTPLSLDAQLLLFVNRDLVNPVCDVLMPALSQQGYLLAIPFLLAGLVRAANAGAASRRTRLLGAIGAFLVACAAVYLGGFVEDLMKEAVGRVRPCRALEGVRLLTACPKSFSLPSGHALSSFVFAVPLFHLSRGRIAPAWRGYILTLAALIAFSRIYLGVHYPTDVLSGALLGSALGLTASYGFLYLTGLRSGREKT